MNYFRRKRVLVTGTCGTIGRELTRQLLEEYGVEELVGIDNNESELFFLEQRLMKFKNASFYLADVTIPDIRQIKMPVFIWRMSGIVTS